MMVHLDQAGRGLAWTELRSPPIHLRSWVEHAWIERYPLERGLRISWKIVPDPNPNLLIHDNGGRRSAVVVGPRTRAVDVPIQHRRWTVGVRFHPGTLPGLSGLPGRDFADRTATLAALFGRVGQEWEDRIQDAAGPEEVLKLAETLVAQRVALEYRIDWRVRLVLQADPTREGLRVEHIARAAGISRRGLHSALGDHVGLSPKKTLSIRRLFRALQSGLRSETPDWSRIALDSGYHDGAHMTRGFRSMLGEPPTTWRARAMPIRTIGDGSLGSTVDESRLPR